MKKIQLALMISATFALGACGSDSSNKSIFPENTGAGTTTGGSSTPIQTTNDNSSTTGSTTTAGGKPTTGSTATAGGKTTAGGSKPTTGKDNSKPNPPPVVAIKPNLKPSSAYSRDQSSKTYGTITKTGQTSAIASHDGYEKAVQGKSLTASYDKTVFNIDVKAGENSTSYHKGLSYSDFGVTVHQAKNLPAGTTHSRDDRVNAYVMGKLTETQRIPTSGVAHYQGDAVIALPRTQKVLVANFNADLNFGQKTFNGKIHQFQVANNGVLTAIHDFDDIQLKGNVVNTADDIGKNGFSGDGFKGQFYGDNAQEIGGIITGNDSNYGPYEGSFGGRTN